MDLQAPCDGPPADPPPARVFSFNVGVEAEAGGRMPTKSFMTLRRDLAALPWLLAGPDDIVLAPPQRPAFLVSLCAAGVASLPSFHPTVPAGRAIAGHRPFGVAGEHLRRSAVAQYRSDVAVCRSLDAVREAFAQHGPKVVLKTEFSSSGGGVRVCEGAASLEPGSAVEHWVVKCLQRDAVVTVEPWLDVLAEFSGEWTDGKWNGVSQCLVENMRWEGHWLGAPAEHLAPDIVDFVFFQRQVEQALAALDVPTTCGSATCGMDVAVVGDADRGLEVRVLELNARTTMSHYALAAKRRMPRARRFDVVRVSELAGQPDLVPLTDPVTAVAYCAVVDYAERS